MVHLMGGSIGLRSRPGHGSTFFFTISLPVAAAGSAVPRSSRSGGSCGGGGSSGSSGSSGSVGSSGSGGGGGSEGGSGSSNGGCARPAAQFIHGGSIDGVAGGTGGLGDESFDGLAGHGVTGVIGGLQRSIVQSSAAAAMGSLENRLDAGLARGRASSSASLGADPSRTQVLIVDDVTMNRKMIKRCVQQLGFACDEACDGAEAVAMCAAKQYSLVLMDNVMPRMNGMEATAAIRRDHAVSGWGGTRIFGLTGNALSEDVAEFQHAGCDEVLTKPLRFDQFKQLLTAYGLFVEPT
jgi:CheY-like chemotaxis protein